MAAHKPVGFGPKLSGAARKKQNPGLPEVVSKTGAGNETRTRDPDLGKVVLYQLSYSRARPVIIRIGRRKSTFPVSCKCNQRSARIAGHAVRR